MNGGRFVGDFADCGGRARGSGRSGDVVDGDRFAGGVSGKGRKWRSGLKWRAGVLGPLTGVASDRGGAVDGEGGGRERVDVGSGSGAADGAGGGSLRGAGRRGDAVECRARGARRGCGAGEPPPCNSANGGSFRRRFRRDLKRFTTARVLGFSADGSGVPAVADGARVNPAGEGYRFRGCPQGWFQRETTGKTRRCRFDVRR